MLDFFRRLILSCFRGVDDPPYGSTASRHSTQAITSQWASYREEKTATEIDHPLPKKPSIFSLQSGSRSFDSLKTLCPSYHSALLSTSPGSPLDPAGDLCGCIVCGTSKEALHSQQKCAFNLTGFEVGVAFLLEKSSAAPKILTIIESAGSSFDVRIASIDLGDHLVIFTERYDIKHHESQLDDVMRPILSRHRSGWDIILEDRTLAFTMFPLKDKTLRQSPRNRCNIDS